MKMNAKYLWQKAALPEVVFDDPPLITVWFKIWWGAAALLIFPGVLGIFMLVSWAVFLAGIAGLAVLLFPLDKLKIKIPDRKDRLTAVIFFPLLLLASALITGLWKKILHLCGISFPEKQPLVETLATADRAGVVILFLSICLITPLLEEILFRRYIYSLWHKFHTASAFAGTALLFAGIHFFLPGLPGLFVLGCGFQYVFLKRDNLACAVIIHMLVNATAFAINPWQ